MKQYYNSTETQIHCLQDSEVIDSISINLLVEILKKIISNNVIHFGKKNTTYPIILIHLWNFIFLLINKMLMSLIGTRDSEMPLVILNVCNTL